mgnify:FL=1
MYPCEASGQLTMPGLGSPEKAASPPKPKHRKPDSELVAVPYFSLDLASSPVDLFGQRHWELRSPYRKGKPPLNTGVAPRKPIRASLADILESNPELKYYLTKTACVGILRRASERGKDLPEELKLALQIQAGSVEGRHTVSETKAYHINQRDEGIDLHGVSGALMATNNMQMQTFVTQPSIMAAGVVTKGNGDCFLSERTHTALSTGGGQAGQGYPCVLTAAFSAGAGASAGSIGYNKEVAPTLKGSAGGNCMPSILCLNDQGGSVMECSENVSGTLRAQEHGHQPILLHPEKNLLYENYGIDSRYTGPHKVSQTLSARMGTGGLNTPLVQRLSEESDYTVYSRQRVDVFQKNNVTSTQSARQHKDATDLISQQADVFAYLIRRLMPLECERLQGFPDGWTGIPNASDSARYKALGNSVAIPCVEFIISQITAALS